MSILDALNAARESLYALHIIGREAGIFASAVANINACIDALNAAKQEEPAHDTNNE